MSLCRSIVEQSVCVVMECSGILSVSSYCPGEREKCVHVATWDFHSLPVNPVIGHKVSQNDRFLCMTLCSQTGAVTECVAV